MKLIHLKTYKLCVDRINYFSKFSKFGLFWWLAPLLIYTIYLNCKVVDLTLVETVSKSWLSIEWNIQWVTYWILFKCSYTMKRNFKTDAFVWIISKPAVSKRICVISREIFSHWPLFVYFYLVLLSDTRKWFDQYIIQISSSNQR